MVNKKIIVPLQKSIYYEDDRLFRRSFKNV